MTSRYLRYKDAPLSLNTLLERIKIIERKLDYDLRNLPPGGAEINDLTAAVTWATVPDGFISASSVTQHESAIDHDALTNFVANEHLTPKNSIVIDGNQLQLDGDQLSPGGDRIYMTNGGGTKGWYSLFALPLGEANTASNVGSGAGVFKQKVGVDLQFYSIVNSISSGYNPVDIFQDIVADELVFNSLAGKAGNACQVSWDVANNNIQIIVQSGKSIVAVSSSLELVNDSSTPGNNKLYGTNASGVKGWYGQPTEINDLTAAVVWANVPDANITQSSVTQHNAALDHGVLAGTGDDDHPQYLNEARHDALPADNPHSVTVTQAVAADAGTDITVAELESLSNGSIDTALALHVHGLPQNTISASRAFADTDVGRALVHSGGSAYTLTMNTTGTFPISGSCYILNVSSNPVTIDGNVGMIGFWVVPGAQKTFALWVSTLKLASGSMTQVIRTATGATYFITQGSAAKFAVGKGISSADSPYTVPEDILDTVLVDTSSGPVTVNLPAINTGSRYHLLTITDKTGNAGTNNITIDGNGTQPINGALTYVIDQNYGSVTIMADYVTPYEWVVVSQSRLPASAIDHDALLNFVAAEHIDWSVTGAEDIHADRLPVVAPVQVFDGTLSSATLNTNVNGTVYTWNDATEHADVTHTDGDSIISFDVAGWYDIYFTIEVSDATAVDRSTWILEIDHLDSSSVRKFLYNASSNVYIRGNATAWDSGAAAGMIRLYMGQDEKIKIQTRLMDFQNAGNNYADTSLSYLRIFRE